MGGWVFHNGGVTVFGSESIYEGLQILERLILGCGFMEFRMGRNDHSQGRGLDLQAFKP